jgi:hypothetical protein
MYVAADFAPKSVRYIKLGPGGIWAADGLKSGILPFGYRKISHDRCAAGDWDSVRKQLIATGRSPRGASQGTREIRDFYELDQHTLWITIAQGHLWWAFAEPDVVLSADTSADGPSRYRRAIGGWRNSSLTGLPLATRSLSSALTRTANFRMTICAVERRDYLLRRIRGESDPLQQKALELKAQLNDVALRMIRQLHWEEFETLIDLIFSRNGWQRSSVLGGDMPDVDLVLNQPSTGETAWVQVKSTAGQAEFDDYLARYHADGSYDRFYFACHTPAGRLAVPNEERVHLWAGAHLAEIAIRSGMFDWLIERTS